jgi:ATP/maltotriose-dependent transcriptional regulator MalT
MAGDLDAQRIVLIDALDHMRSSGARRLEFGCLNWLSNNAYYRGDFAAAHAYHLEASRRVAEGSSPMQRLFAARSRANWAWVAGDLANAEALALEQLRLARDLALTAQVGIAYWWVGFVLRDKGDLAGARRAFEDSVATLAPTAAQALRAEARAQLAPICLALGDLDAARTQAETARAEVTADDAYTQATSRGALAQVRAAEGRVAEAEQLFLDGLTAVARTGYGAVQADLRRHYGAFLIKQGRLGEARRELDVVRAFYDSDLVRLEREKTDALLRRADVRGPGPASVRRS